MAKQPRPPKPPEPPKPPKPPTTEQLLTQIITQNEQIIVLLTNLSNGLTPFPKE